MLVGAPEAGLSAAGADVMLLGPMPTPAIAYLTRTFHAEGLQAVAFLNERIRNDAWQ